MTALLHRPALRRFRGLLAATVIAGTALGIQATPVPVPAPVREALTTPVAQASFCASNPNFAGHITETSGTTAAAGRIKDGTIYGYITDVNSTWSCTAFLRYDGAAWNVNSSAGRFDWGVVISSTSVPCNYVVGSNNFIKGNPSTTACWTSDTQYALPMTLGAERVYQMDTAHNSIGDMMYIHSDCGTLYGGGDGEAVSGTETAPESFAGSNAANRPGANCDPLTIDGFQGQTITYDKTAPVFGFTFPAGAPGTIASPSAASYTVKFDAIDGVAKFGSGHQWTLQRRIADNSGPGTCTGWKDDIGTSAKILSSNEGAAQTSVQGLDVGHCYYWTLSGSDMNGNPGAPKNSATVIVETTAPVATFLSPVANSAQNATSYSVSWSELESGSGIATRSLQRQKTAISGGACGTTWTNDGAAVTTSSPVAATLVSGSCYRWTQTLTDRANNAGTTPPSATVLVDTTLPMASAILPTPGTTTAQTAGSYTVGWTESAGSGATITSRSLERQIATASNPSVCGTWGTDATFSGQASPKNETLLASGNCYRWAITLTNSLGKTTTTFSGTVIIDATAPTGSIVSPVANQPGTGDMDVIGRAEDEATFQDYVVEYGAGATPSSWTTIATGVVAVSTNARLASWATAGLSGVYTLRLTVHDRAGNTMTPVTSTVVLENAARGTESYLTRVPYDLGGGYTLDVGVANGEARLSRDLFSIPSFGPSQSLSLTYSSAESGTTGKFGVGWSSNLTQYLTFDAVAGAPAFTTWHRADGGREPFGNVGGTWMPGRGHYETMTIAGSEVTITTKDQTHYVFESTGAGRLKRIENRFQTPLTLTWGTSSATATDYSGRSTTLAIDSTNNRITGVTDSAGRAWAFGYTGTGTASDLTTITDPASKVTTLGYASHALTSVQRSRSPGPVTITWTVGYTSGQATSVKDPILSHPNLFTYTPGTTTVQAVTDDGAPDYAQTDYGLDTQNLGEVVEQTEGQSEAEATTTRRTFDPNGNLVADGVDIDDDSADVTRQFDGRGNVTLESREISEDETVDTVYTYNATNDLLTRTDADNDDATRMVTRYTFDGPGRLVSENRGCTSSGTFIAQGLGGSLRGAAALHHRADVLLEPVGVETGFTGVQVLSDGVGVGVGQFVVEELVQALQRKGTIAVSHRKHPDGPARARARSRSARRAAGFGHD